MRARDAESRSIGRRSSPGSALTEDWTWSSGASRSGARRRGVDAAGLYAGDGARRRRVAIWGGVALPDGESAALERATAWRGSSCPTRCCSTRRGRELPAAGAPELLLTQAEEIRKLRERLAGAALPGRATAWWSSRRSTRSASRSPPPSNLEELAEGILLRAVSLSDARRGALYLLEDSAFRLRRTIGGDARPTVSPGDDAARAPARRLRRLRAGHPAGRALHHGGADRGRRASRSGCCWSATRRAAAASGRSATPTAARSACSPTRRRSRSRTRASIARRWRRSDSSARWSSPPTSSASSCPPARRGCPASSSAAGTGRRGRSAATTTTSSSWAATDWALLVADVTGKGMPAALLVSTLHSSLRLLFDGAEVGDGLLSRLNEHIVRSSSPNKFITLILAELEPATGRLRSFNAGHNPGLLVRPSGEIDAARLRRDADRTPRRVHLPLADASTWDTGDLLCLYSDGITECTSPADEEFGLERLEAVAARRARPSAGRDRARCRRRHARLRRRQPAGRRSDAGADAAHRLTAQCATRYRLCRLVGRHAARSAARGCFAVVLALGFEPLGAACTRGPG